MTKIMRPAYELGSKCAEMGLRAYAPFAAAMAFFSKGSITDKAIGGVSKVPTIPQAYHDISTLADAVQKIAGQYKRAEDAMGQLKTSFFGSETEPSVIGKLWGDSIELVKETYGTTVEVISGDKSVIEGAKEIAAVARDNLDSAVREGATIYDNATVSVQSASDLVEKGKELAAGLSDNVAYDYFMNLAYNIDNQLVDTAAAAGIVYVTLKVSADVLEQVRLQTKDLTDEETRGRTITQCYEKAVGKKIFGTGHEHRGIIYTIVGDTAAYATKAAVIPVAAVVMVADKDQVIGNVVEGAKTLDLSAIAEAGNNLAGQFEGAYKNLTEIIEHGQAAAGNFSGLPDTYSGLMTNLSNLSDAMADPAPFFDLVNAAGNNFAHAPLQTAIAVGTAVATAYGIHRLVKFIGTKGNGTLYENIKRGTAKTIADAPCNIKKGIKKIFKKKNKG